MAQSFYFSPTNTTKKVIEGIVKGLATEVTEHNLTFVEKNSNDYEVSKDEIAIIGVPVYSGRVPEIILDSLKSIKGNGGVAIAVVTYGNRAYEDALLELVDILKGQNFKVIGAGAFIGEHSYTQNVGYKRPDDEDMMVAENFGKEVSKKLKSGNLSEVSVPGNYPYKERKPKLIFAPVAKNECVYCRKCPVVCPVYAIDMRKPDIVNVEKCIHCCACIKVCGFNAREIRDENALNIIKWLEDNYKDRKNIEIFI